MLLSVAPLFYILSVAVIFWDILAAAGRVSQGSTNTASPNTGGRRNHITPGVGSKSRRFGLDSIHWVSSTTFLALPYVQHQKAKKKKNTGKRRSPHTFNRRNGRTPEPGQAPGKHKTGQRLESGIAYEQDETMALTI